MSAVALGALLVAVVVLVETCPAPARRAKGRGRPKVSRAPGAPVRRRSGWVRGLRRLTRLGRADEAVDVAALMTEVAARLRAGAPVHAAWARALDRAGVDDVAHGPPAAAFLRLASQAGSRNRDPESLRAQVAALHAAIRLAEHLGAPLADVLDRCASGVAAAGRAESARRVALAGPTSTARLLSALPLLGVLLGTALGADPLAALLDGGLGTGAGLAGLGLLVLGHRWTALLVRAARTAGADEPSARVEGSRP